jgi:hypothetical protein
LSRQLGNEQLLGGYQAFLNKTYGPQLDNLYKGLGKELPNEAKGQIENIIFDNNLMSHILNSPEFNHILNEERRLKGEDVKVGAVICIDGRIYILDQFGRTINVKEIAGSLIELNDDKSGIKDIDFIGALEQSAREGKELLEIVTAHTGHHKCGRIAEGIDKNEFSGDPDRVAITEAEKRALLIEKKYNQILHQQGKEPQRKVAIPAMINTDDMGLTLNFGKEKPLSTTNFTRQLRKKIEHNFLSNQFGSMKDKFNKPENFIEYSKKVLEITKYLMETELGETRSFTADIKKYIKANYSDLTKKQQKALLFTFCRTIANQYVTGMALEEINKKSPYADHNEQYMVVSTGKPFGRFHAVQGFASATSSSAEMLNQVKIELGLLDGHHKSKPYILFVSTSVPATDKNINESRAIGYYQKLFSDPEVRNRIDVGELVVVPILINEKNGEVLSVQDYSIYI